MFTELKQISDVFHKNSSSLSIHQNQKDSLGTTDSCGAALQCLYSLCKHLHFYTEWSQVTTRHRLTSSSSNGGRWSRSSYPSLSAAFIKYVSAASSLPEVSIAATSIQSRQWSSRDRWHVWASSTGSAEHRLRTSLRCKPTGTIRSKNRAGKSSRDTQHCARTERQERAEGGRGGGVNDGPWPESEAAMTTTTPPQNRRRSPAAVGVFSDRGGVSGAEAWMPRSALQLHASVSMERLIHCIATVAQKCKPEQLRHLKMIILRTTYKRQYKRVNKKTRYRTFSCIVYCSGSQYVVRVVLVALGLPLILIWSVFLSMLFK